MSGLRNADPKRANAWLCSGSAVWATWRCSFTCPGAGNLGHHGPTHKAAELKSMGAHEVLSAARSQDRDARRGRL